MKNLILTIAFFVTCLTSFSQTIVAEVNSWYIFESKLTDDHNTIISDTEKKVTRYEWGDNKLTFDLKNKTYKFFFLGNEYADGKMTYELKDDVYVFICKTIDLNTNLPMDLYVTVNNSAKSKEAYVTEYYLDDATNKTYGMICYKN